MSDFLDEYEKLAASIAMEANMAATALGDKIDALKALTPFYVYKMKTMKPVDDSADLTFDNFQRTIHATEN